MLSFAINYEGLVHFFSVQIENFVPIMIQRVFCRRAATMELKDRKLTGMHSPSQCSKPSLDYMGKFFFFYKTSIYNVLNCIKFLLRPYVIITILINCLETILVLNTMNY